MSEPYAGPKDGDYVAYLEALERERLAQLIHAAGHPGTHFTPASSHVAGGRKADRSHTNDDSKPLSASQAKVVLDGLAAADRAGHIDLRRARAALLPIAIGLGLAMFGLIADGGLFIVLIGAIIAFSGLRTLIKAVGPAVKAGTGPAAADARLRQAGFTATKSDAGRR